MKKESWIIKLREKIFPFNFHKRITKKEFEIMIKNEKRRNIK